MQKEGEGEGINGVRRLDGRMRRGQKAGRKDTERVGREEYDRNARGGEELVSRNR